jgi:hypothetical protein
MMARIEISTLIGDLDAIANNLKGRLGEEQLQILTGFQAELEAWLVEARELERQQELATGHLRQTTERRQLTQRRGVELRSRAAGHLRGVFGPKAKQLHEFGLRPRRDPRPVKKARQPAPPGPTPQPTSPESPGEPGSST